jgi:gliding motility-associated protein GldM
MSIPKEPRQLMINLMYLVLTAMLALNVSAEIINAFFALDKGNQESMDIVGKQLDATEKSLDDLLADDAKQKFQPISPAVDEIRATTKELVLYINSIRDKLIDEGGNKNGAHDDEDYYEDHGKKVPKGKKNKDVTTRMLVDEGAGTELENKIISTRDKLIAIYSKLIRENWKNFDLQESEVEAKIQAVTANMTLEIDEAWKTSDKNSWAEFKFKQMPLAAVLPLLSQIQSNTRSAEANIVNDLAAVAGGKTIVLDQFFPVINAQKSYVIKGEPFKAEISLGSYSSQLDPSNIQLTVNGSPVKVGADGKAILTQMPNSTGTKKLTLGCKVTNPLTGEVKTGTSTFEYEVGRRSATVAADKMNVFYVGIDNPITLSAAGVPSAQLKVSCEGGSMTGSGAKRIIRPTRKGKAYITLSGGGLASTKFEFRVKRIPNPLVTLAKQVDGSIKAGTFKAQLGLLPELQDFEFDAKCKIQSYVLYYTPRGADPSKIDGSGTRFSGQVKAVIQKAKIGDQYAFTNVKAKCPGDTAGRRVNGLSFKIK